MNSALPSFLFWAPTRDQGGVENGSQRLTVAGGWNVRANPSLGNQKRSQKHWDPEKQTPSGI